MLVENESANDKREAGKWEVAGNKHSEGRSLQFILCTTQVSKAKCHLGANSAVEMTRLSQCPVLHDHVMKSCR